MDPSRWVLTTDPKLRILRTLSYRPYRPYGPIRAVSLDSGNCSQDGVRAPPVAQQFSQLKLLLFLSFVCSEYWAL